MVNLVKFNKYGFPTCEEHGAMAAVNKDVTLWRCLECHIGIDTINMKKKVIKQKKERCSKCGVIANLWRTPEDEKWYCGQCFFEEKGFKVETFFMVDVE